jgi:hypothetical protein
VMARVFEERRDEEIVKIGVRWRGEVRIGL